MAAEAPPLAPPRAAAVLPLAAARDPQRVGGKAAGLARLLDAGLRVPAGFVVPAAPSGDGPDRPALREAVERQLAAHGGADDPWAVRSSAVGEDGARASFAGQLETSLGRRGVDAVLEAIDACVRSGRARRVSVYAQAQRPEAEAALPVAVVVQRQVDAAWAGALLTADPVRGLRDRFVLSAAPGLGEALVGGQVDGLDFTVHATGAVLSGPPEDVLARVAAEAAQDPELLLLALPRLVADARRAVRRLGQPLDMEWAVARPASPAPAPALTAPGQAPEAGGVDVWWLQARPVTTLPAAHPNELDAPWPPARALLTRGNIGEMMPGPVTPLTASVFGRAVDMGLQDFAASVGAQGPPDPNTPRYIQPYYAHLFFDLDALYTLPRHVAWNTKQDVDLSIVGRPLPGAGPPPAGRWRRARNLLRLVRYLRRAAGRERALATLASSLRWDPALAEDPGATMRWLGGARDLLVTAYAHHYATSALSGTYHAALMRVLAGGALTRTAAHHAAAAALLGDIEGVESADIVRGVEALARALTEHPGIHHLLRDAALDPPLGRRRAARPATRMVARSGGATPPRPAACLLAQPAPPAPRSADQPAGWGHPEAAERRSQPGEALWAWLQTAGPRSLRERFEAFLEAHGHRAVREAELRTRDWHDDPAALVSLVRARASTAAPAQAAPAFDLGAALRALDPALGVTRLGRLVLRALVPRARAAVARRERTKSLAIRAQRQVKLGYRALGERLAALGRLPDPDAVFFLTHDELTTLVEGGAAASALGAHAAARRALYPWLESLRFQDVGRGLPRPLEPGRSPPPRAAGALAGLPVSPGQATGRARVVRTLADASRLAPGDILVAPTTDVGWTPYFGLVAGLVTEVGSPLSHGAVVAREYGLPAVVGVVGACDALADEPVLTVDGAAGTVRPATPP